MALERTNAVANNLSVVVRVNPTLLEVAGLDKETVEFVSVTALMNGEEIGSASASRESEDTADSRSSFVNSVIMGAARRMVGDKPSGPYVQIHNINVSEPRRRNGYGTVLLHEVLLPFESNSMVTVRVSNEISPDWFGHRGFYERRDRPVLESPCLFAVQRCIELRREHMRNTQPDYDRRIEP